jgi:eukaryotic translation initiation factor 2C
MVFGADVYHSGVNEQHMPSIASVCASMDAAATIYSGRYSVNKVPRNETIEQLDLMVIDLLKAFRAKNGRLPERILFYRDGVSEGQFRKVMEVEVDMLRKAFKGGYGDKPPKLTFVIVQKRHHTR